MKIHRLHKLSSLILIVSYILTSIMPANTLPAFAAAPRFAIDEYNSRQIKDSFMETGLPFHEAWTCNLQGKVNSQPIVVDGYVYVQAGKDLVKLSLEDGNILGRITVNQHELPSGSSPTYAETTHAPRIYQATHDKDGDYTVRIRVEYAGKNGLYLCKLKTVKIWGDMYDDIYTAPLPLDLR